MRPGLYGALHDWRLLRGRDSRPPVGAWGAHDRRIAAWLELQFLWRSAFAACCRPDAPDIAHMCVKLVADPARIWLWLAHAEQVVGRREALERAVRRLPEEESMLRRALDLQRALPRLPEPPLAELLPACVRLSARIAAEVAVEETLAVRLLGAEGDELALPAAAGRALRELTGTEPLLLPLVDWRARAWPLPPDEAFCPVGLDPGTPTAVAAAAATGAAGPQPALKADGLMVFASTRGAVLRSIQCAATDPVSFALARGRSSAEFPCVPGWSAADSAQRAVGEHAAWLGVGDTPSVSNWALGQARSTGPSLHAMGMLLTAARAGLFLESVEADEPELALTTAAVARRLGERDSGARVVAEETSAVYAACRLDGRRPPARTVRALRELVLELPAYAPGTPLARPAAKAPAAT